MVQCNKNFALTKNCQFSLVHGTLVNLHILECRHYDMKLADISEPVV